MTAHPPTGTAPHLSRRRRLRAAVALAIAVVCVACGSSSSKPSALGPSGSASTGSGTATPADLTKAAAAATTYPAIPTIPGGVAAMKGKTVWWIPVGASLPFMGAVTVGMQAALAQMGATLHVCDGKLLPTAMASCMDDAASQGAAAVVTGFIDYTLVPNAFDNLVAKHIPVLVAGEAADGGKKDSPQLAFYDTIDTETALQKTLADAVIADSKGRANILYIGNTDSPQLSDTLAYTRTYYKTNCPGCTFNEIDYLTVAAAKLPSQVSAGLISHPDTTYVVQQLDPTGAGVVNAIRLAGKSTSIKYAAAGGGLDSMQRISSGQQLADVGISGVYTGWQFSDGIARMVTGSTPTVGLTAYRLFTKDNVGSITLTPAAYATNAWYGNDTYKQNFAKAWGLG